jgi:hypothetical protein
MRRNHIVHLETCISITGHIIKIHHSNKDMIRSENRNPHLSSQCSHGDPNLPITLRRATHFAASTQVATSKSAATAGASVSHSAVPNSVRPTPSKFSRVSTSDASTSPSADAYTRDMPSARCESCMDCAMCEMSVVRACRADGRNCGRGWRALKACSQAYSEMHTQDT